MKYLNSVGSLGIIGGGALLFAGTSFIGQGLIAPAAIGALGNGKKLVFKKPAMSEFCRVGRCWSDDGQLHVCDSILRDSLWPVLYVARFTQRANLSLQV